MLLSTSAPSIKVKKPELTFYQKAFLNSSARFTITEAGTKTGKTFSHIWWLFHQAHTYQAASGRNYWWVAPVYAQAKIAYNRMWSKLAPTGVYKTNKSELTITTPIGTVVHFKTAKDPDNLYGEDVYSAVFDEFTRAKEEAWHALRSTLTATKAPCKFIGNFKGKANWGHQLSLKAKDDPNYEYFRITAWDAVKAGVLEEEEILQAQKDLPLFLFKALYLAEGDVDEARLISDEAIEGLFVNTHLKASEDKRKFITADIAMHGSDKFVVAVWEGFKIIEFKVFDKCDGKQVEQIIKKLMDKHQIPRRRVAYDADGLGSYLKGYLKGAKAFNNGGKPIKVKGRQEEYGKLKDQCYFRMAERVNDGGIMFDCNIDKYKTEIWEDMEMVANRSWGTDDKLKVLKKEDIREYIGRSPDYSDVIMMREYFELNSFKRVV